jgi:hypothetical protein
MLNELQRTTTTAYFKVVPVAPPRSRNMNFQALFPAILPDSAALCSARQLDVAAQRAHKPVHVLRQTITNLSCAFGPIAHAGTTTCAAPSCERQCSVGEGGAPLLLAMPWTRVVRPTGFEAATSKRCRRSEASLTVPPCDPGAREFHPARRRLRCHAIP